MSDEDLEYEFEKSKTQKKREAHEVQDLGERLVSLSIPQLESLPLDDSLLHAILEAKKIKAHGGKKRQLQFIGKLMRNIELDPIIEFFDVIDNKSQLENIKFKQMEKWRDRIVAEGNEAIQELCRINSTFDVQKMRQLARNAANKKNEKLALKSKRAIFQFVKEILQESQN